MLASTKTITLRILFFSGFLLVIAGIITVIVILMIDVIPLNVSPIRSAQVKVVDKRVVEKQGGDNGRTFFTHIVAFEFPDGSTKELNIGIDSVGRSQLGETRETGAYYDSMNEGDTGILTYKEMKNLEERIKTEDMRFDGRRFISFEKDPATESDN